MGANWTLNTWWKKLAYVLGWISIVGFVLNVLFTLFVLVSLKGLS